MSCSIWARNIVPGELLTIAPSQDIRITNIALARESSDLGRVSLTLSFMVNNTTRSPQITICTLMLGRTDQTSTDLRLIKGGKYLLQVEGLNPISLIGFKDATTHAASVSPSGVSQNDDPKILMGLRPNIGPSGSPSTESRVLNRGLRAEAQNVGPRATPDQTVGMRPEAQTGAMRAEAQAVRVRAEAQAVRVRAEAQAVRVRAEAQAVRMRAEAQAVGMRAEDQDVGSRAEDQAVGTWAEAPATGMLAEGQVVGKRSQTQAVGKRAEAQAIRKQADVQAVGTRTEVQVVGTRTEANDQAVGPRVQRSPLNALDSQVQHPTQGMQAVGTRAETAQGISSNAPSSQAQNVGMRAKDFKRSSNAPNPRKQPYPSELRAPPSGITSTTQPLSGQNMPRSPSSPASVATMPNAFHAIGVPTSFPFTPNLGLNSKAAHHMSAGDSGSSIYDSMHAPKTNYAIAPQLTHAPKPTHPPFRFNAPSMMSAEIPASDPASIDSALTRIDGTSLDLASSDKGKQKANENEIVSQIASGEYETDSEDI
ncbi:hypothetical protein EV360DRAFT_72720 [Lentinula raphanica]|nr:hypothetical protein EV360DRAFT_72720 [Lentinula raphanica]